MILNMLELTFPTIDQGECDSPIPNVVPPQSRQLRTGAGANYENLMFIRGIRLDRIPRKHGVSRIKICFDEKGVSWSFFEVA